jgi:hypothetical protein
MVNNRWRTCEFWRFKALDDDVMLVHSPTCVGKVLGYLTFIPYLSMYL